MLAAAAARRLAVAARRSTTISRNRQSGSNKAPRRTFFLFGGNAPKGFGHFFPKGKTAKGGAKTTTKKTGAKSAGKKTTAKATTGGGGDGNGLPPDLGPRVVSALAALGLLGVWLSSRDNQGTEINWQEFATVLLESGEVDRIIVTNAKVAEVLLRPNASVSLAKGQQEEKTDELRNPYAWDSTKSTEEPAAPKTRYPRIGSAGPQQTPSYHFAIGSVEIFERKLEAAQRALGIEARDFVPVQYVTETNWAAEGAKFLPTLLIIGAWLYVMKSMGGGGSGGGGGGMSNIFRIGQNKAKQIKKEDVNVTYADVAGCDEAKREVMEFVEFLKEPDRFTKLGAKIPKGALLCGPPGTGKTLLAKATAGEANVPFYSISGSEFVEMFVGVGPSRVRDLFKEARANQPCMIFIDEIDAIGKQRGKGGFAGGNDERENTLNQLLVEMDGFTESGGENKVVVLAGTNRADVLDKALVRPGRFDRQITVGVPDIKGRKDIFLVHLKGLNLDGPPEQFAGRMAGLTPGFAGAEIQNVCNEAAIVAARRSADAVSYKDFEVAADRVLAGLESNKIMTPEEKRIVAFHEAGHAVSGWFLEHADPLLKVTIVPRGSGALGFAQYLPKEVALRNRAQIVDIICMALGGRAAEQLIFGDVTNGASNDLMKVTGMAYSMIRDYGMSDNARIGQLAFPQSDDPFAQRPYSEATAQAMDEEAKKIVDDAYQRVLSLLGEKEAELSLLAELLIDKETINHDDIVECLGERPFVTDKQYAEFITAYAEKEAVLEDGVEEEKEDKIPEEVPLAPA